MDNIKNSLEKLFNSLGNKMSNDYYGLQFNFKVDDIVKDKNHNFYTIFVSTDKPIPATLFVEISDWEYGKFSNATYLAMNLENLSKYVGMDANTMDINLTNVESSKYFNEDIMVKDYEDDFYIIEDTGTALHIPSGMTYPLYSDGSIDSRNGYHLSEIESEDWWELLTNQDKEMMTQFYKP